MHATHACYSKTESSVPWRPYRPERNSYSSGTQSIYRSSHMIRAILVNNDLYFQTHFSFMIHLYSDWRMFVCLFLFSFLFMFLVLISVILVICVFGTFYYLTSKFATSLPNTKFSFPLNSDWVIKPTTSPYIITEHLIAV